MALTQISTKGIKDGTITNADIGASAAIDGSKVSPSFTSDITITNTAPTINFVDTNQNSDFQINVDGGKFMIKDTTNNATRLKIQPGGLFHIQSPKTRCNDLQVDGDVGIGIQTPSEPLHINSATTLNGLLISSTNNSTRATMELNGKDSSGNEVELRLGGFGDTSRGEIFTVTNHSLGFATNNAASQMVLDTNGKVGIGTTTPSNFLEVEGGSTTSTQVVVDGTGRYRGLEINENGTRKAYFHHDATDNKATLNTAEGILTFATGDTERMRIDSSGKVGIGTTTIGNKLQVHEASSNASFAGFSNDTTGSSSSDGLIVGVDSDENGVLYHYENKAIRFATNNSERMRLDSSGNLVLGSSTASGALTVVSTKNAESGRSNSQNYHLHLRNNENDNGEAIGISFGITSSSTGVGASILHERDSTGSQGSLQFYTNGDGSNVAERMRIHSAGELSIATTSKNLQGGGASDFYLNIQSNTGSNHNGIIVAGVASGHGAFTTKPSANHTYLAGFFMNSSGSEIGNITCISNAVGFNSTSDYRLKENVISISDGITRLKQLTPRRFNWISDETNTLQDGFLAHEVSSIVPEAITGEKDAIATEDDGMHKEGDPIYQSMDYAKITPLLTAALQEAITKIEVLETEVAALKAS